MAGLAATAMPRRGTKHMPTVTMTKTGSGRASTSVAMTVAIDAQSPMASLRRDCYRSPWQ